MLTGEWKPVVGFEDCYVVSTDGRIARTTTHAGRPHKVWKVLAHRKKHGYVTVHLCRKGVRTDPLVHRLMWSAFKGPIPDKMDINHLNGVRHENRFENFELATRSENCAHSFRVLGRKKFHKTFYGSDHGAAKFRDDQIRDIRSRFASGEPMIDMAREFGVTDSCINCICKNKTWKHLL